MSTEFYKISENELYHHGILGMHWGIRRFQPYRKGERGGKEVGEAAKKSRGTSFRERRAKKRMAEQQAVILQQARAAKDEKEARAARLEEVKKRPTATEVLEFVDELSNDDLNDLNKRIKSIRELEETSQKEKDAGFDRIDKAMTKVKSVKDWGKTGIESYKTIADILEILDGSYTESKILEKKRREKALKDMEKDEEKLREAAEYSKESNKRWDKFLDESIRKMQNKK